LEEGIASRERRVKDDFGDCGVAMGRNILFEVRVGGAERRENVPFEGIPLPFACDVLKVVHG
jgi:hypothetical protein